MVLCAYHASHEQFAPSALVHYVRLAEHAGFTAVSSSDHLQPWSTRQGQSGFAWAWLGAAMQASALPCSLVCAPGPRYHPLLIAQAAATLAELFPGRFRLALGSGEALNERVLGGPWPQRLSATPTFWSAAVSSGPWGPARPSRVTAACGSRRGGCIPGRRCHRGSSGPPSRPRRRAGLAAGPTAC